ncbi:SDR family NAD(P)-dependent oxidoreductase [Lysobacter humi (ex Lee et al. 2017)]
MIGALLVIGATGTIGRAVVEAALAQGRAVVAVARGCTALSALEAAHPGADLTCLRASLSCERGGARLVTRLRRLGRPIGDVVLALRGAGERGRVLDASADALRQRIDDDVQPCLVAARHLLPWLATQAPGARFVVVGGPGSETPWAGYGHRSIGAAALKMLVRVLHEEARATGVRVQMLDVDRPACTERNREQACPQWPRARAIGEQAARLASTRDARAPAIVPFRDPAPMRAGNHLTAARALLHALATPNPPQEPSP